MTPTEHAARIREALDVGLAETSGLPAHALFKSAQVSLYDLSAALVDRDARIQEQATMISDLAGAVDVGRARIQELEREVEGSQRDADNWAHIAARDSAQLVAAQQALTRIMHVALPSEDDNEPWHIAREALAGVDVPPQEASEPDAGGAEGSVGQSAESTAGPNRTAGIGDAGQEVGLTASGSLTSPVAQEPNE